jgi:7-cyano-7-deazaguanine synthase in queuosine biosynthesis
MVGVIAVISRASTLWRLYLAGRWIEGRESWSCYSPWEWAFMHCASCHYQSTTREGYHCGVKMTEIGL